MGGLAPLDFSLVIAFLLPGFVAFYSLIYVSPMVARLVTALLAGEASVGGSLVLLLFSLAVGVITSAVRALVVDPFQHLTGVVRLS